MTIPEISMPVLVYIVVGLAALAASVVTKVLTWRGQMLDNALKSVELQQKLEAQASKQQLQRIQALGPQNFGKTDKKKRAQRISDLVLDIIAVSSMVLFMWQAFRASPLTRGAIAIMIGSATVLLITLILNVVSIIVNWQKIMNDRITLIMQTLLLMTKRD